MRLFLDTEFTDLVPGARLISIALVDEDENFFYAELTDTWEYDDCSPFVHNFVLPFLKLGKYKMTRNECAVKMAQWIEDRNVSCIIASDAPNWDMPFFEKLINSTGLWPENLMKDMIYPIRVTSEQEAAMVEKYDYDIHCALDDAMIMKKVTLGY